MMSRAEQLAWRRRCLIAECSMQRADLSLQMTPLRHDLLSVEAGLRIVERAGRHPGWLAAAAIGLMLVRPRRLSSLLRLASAGLRTWRTLGPVLRYVPPP